MAEQFLTLMADLDDKAQERMSGWYDSLREAGFTGIQTPGLPYHISLSTFPLEQEKEAAEIARKAGEKGLRVGAVAGTNDEAAKALEAGAQTILTGDYLALTKSTGLK